jgi:hypothetical protein
MKGYDPLPEGYYGNSIVDGKLVLEVSHYKKTALERPPKTDAKFQKTDATSYLAST